MKLRRASPPSTRRQRLRDEAMKEQTLPAFSYRARRPQESKAVRTPMGRFWLQRFGLIILFLAAGASTINVLTLVPTAKVVPLTNTTSSPFFRDQSVYEAAANQVLKGSIWNRSKITINTDQINRSLQDQFPELVKVSVALPLLTHRPVVYVEPAQPALILLTSNDGAYLIDTGGKALQKAISAAALNQPQLLVLHDQSRLQIRLNHQALTATSINFIQTIVVELAARHVFVVALTLPGAASELDAQLANLPYLVKFNLETHTPREQAGTFLATIAQLQRQNITPMQYVDARVEGRAYYQ